MRGDASFNPDAVEVEEAKRTEQPQAQQWVSAIDRALKSALLMAGCQGMRFLRRHTEVVEGRRRIKSTTRLLHD
jgi:hypothetical protein